MTAIGNLVTFVMFGSVGYLLSRCLPSSLTTVLLLLVGAVVGSWIGVNTLLVSLFGLAVHLNWAISACCLGLLAGVLMQRRYAVAH